MNQYSEKLFSCLDFVQKKVHFEPAVGLILGSGLGPVADTMQVVSSVDYKDIPGFPVSTVPGHAGRYLFGYIRDVPVVCMQGRVHYYEGFDVHDVVLPVRVMGLLGVKCVFLTNAAGGLDPEMETPSLMVIRDQMMFNFPNPLIGPNLEELGPRFPDMSEIYDVALRRILHSTAEKLNMKLQEGVYIQLTGPSFETPFEVRYYRSIGGSAVGMSTACEAVAARHMGLRVCGISCITNKGAGLTAQPLTHQEVMEAGQVIANSFSSLVTAAVPAIYEEIKGSP